MFVNWLPLMMLLRKPHTQAYPARPAPNLPPRHCLSFLEEFGLAALLSMPGAQRGAAMPEIKRAAMEAA